MKKKKQGKSAIEELLEDDGIEPLGIKLGDASIASPFTARSPSINVVLSYSLFDLGF